MKIDIKWIIGILGTILMSLSTWVLLSVVDLKEQNLYQRKVISN
jgi:hypothetical protein